MERNSLENYIAVKVTSDNCFTSPIEDFKLEKADPSCKKCHGSGTEGWIGVTFEDKPHRIRIACPICYPKVYHPREVTPPEKVIPTSILRRIVNAVIRRLRRFIPGLI